MTKPNRITHLLTARPAGVATTQTTPTTADLAAGGAGTAAPTSNTRDSRNRPTSRLRRRLALVATLFVTSLSIVVIGANPAAAHAELVSSEPVAGAVVGSVDRFELRWNEVVQTGDAQIRLLDTSGKPTDLTVEVDTVDNTSVAVLTPTGELAEGPWVITWKVVSADGHLISGSIPFSYEAVATPQAIIPTGELSEAEAIPQLTTDHRAHHPELLTVAPLRSDGPLDRTTEALSWLAVLAAAGALLGLHRGFAGVAAVAGVTLGAARAAQISTDFGGGFLATGEARSAAAVAVAASVLAFTAAAWHVLHRRVVAALIAVALLMFSAQSLFSGHHLDLDGTSRMMATTAHSTHLLAMAVWVAAVIAAAMNPTERQLRTTRRLSTIALPVLVVAGSLLAYLLVFPSGSLADSTTWLAIFAAKVALMLVAIIVGWVHHRRCSEERITSTRLTTWRRTLGAEVALFTFIAAVSATLTMHTPPAVGTPSAGTVTQQNEQGTGERSTDSDSSAALNPTGDTVTGVELNFPGGAKGTLTVDSLVAASPASWTLELLDADGEPVDVAFVTVEASNAAADLTGVDVTLQNIDAGRYQATHALPVAGTWQLHITFLLDQFTLEHAMTQVTALPAVTRKVKDQPNIPNPPAQTNAKQTTPPGDQPAVSQPLTTLEKE